MDPASKIFVLFFKIILCLFNFGHYILLNILPKIATRNNHQESLQSVLDRDRYISDWVWYKGLQSVSKRTKSRHQFLTLPTHDSHY